MEVVDVVVRWAGTVVAVERLARGERFTMGASAAAPRHFVWHHPSLDAGAEWVVEHGPEGARMRAAGGATLIVDGKRTDEREVLLGKDEHATVSLGAIEVQASAARRTRAAPVAHVRDARFLRVSGTALVVHAGFVCALLLTRELPSSSLEMPATTRLIAESWAARPPRPVATTTRAQASSLFDAIPQSREPRPRAARVAKDARALAQEVLAALHLDAGASTSPFGADGRSLGASFAQGLKGGSGPSSGFGGRRGAGGVSGAAIAVGSLGALGDGDDGDAPSLGLPAKERVPVRIVVDRFDHQDGLSRDEIARVMDRARTQVKACYERELGGAPDLQGKVVLGFTIAGSGDVAAVRAAQNTLADAAGARVGGCVERVVGRLKFPPPRGGGVVQVTYPFVLAVSGG